MLGIAVPIVCTLSNEVKGDTTISGAYGTAWTEGYEVKDNAEFDIEIKGGEGTSENIITIFGSSKTQGVASPREEIGAFYKEYMVVQTDCFGWGFGENCSLDGNPINFYNNVDDYDKDGDVWDDFTDIMKDAHIDATVLKTSTGVELKYYVTGANGCSFTYKAQSMVDTSEGLYVIFACNNSTVTVKRVDYGVVTEKETTEKIADMPEDGVVSVVGDDIPMASGTTDGGVTEPENIVAVLPNDSAVNDISDGEQGDNTSESDTIIYTTPNTVDIQFEDIPKAAPQGVEFVEQKEDEEFIYKVIAVVAIFVMIAGVVYIGQRDSKMQK